MRRRIMVIEDDPSIAELVSLILRTSGLDPAIASTGKGALDLLADHAHDLVLLDLRMPDIDGWFLIQRIREAWPGLPVIVLTARASSGADVSRLRAAGAVDVIQKPFNPDDLVSRVRRSLPTRGAA